MPSTNIKNLSVSQLLAMRADIDKLLQSKKTELQAQLAQIGGDVGDRRTGRKAGSIKGSKVAPKYRHPKTGETWSGRGGVAGWLAREIKGGKKREDFLIAKPGRKKRAKAK
jgi:DNA-binding protein H-NS